MVRRDGALGAGLFVSAVLALGGCGKTQGAAHDMTGDGAAGAAPTGDDANSVGGGVSATGVGATGGSGGSGGTAACVEEAYPQKRIVRLSFHQLVSSVRAWFGAELADQLSSEHEIALSERDSLPLRREGILFTDVVWQTSDAVAQAVGQYVTDHFDDVTGCAEPTEACATDYLVDLAEKAYRRPPSDEELERVLLVFSEVRDTEASVEESTGFAAYAVMSAPQFLYRTEFGSDVTADEPLTALERASQLSYFVADGPPDAELLEAAEQGALQSDDDWRDQAQRLLATPEAQENLSAALAAHFDLPILRYVVIDPAVAPEFNEELRNSMLREAQWLARQVWQGGPIEGLLTSREGYVNEPLATLYGVEFPPADSAVDADGFARITLPEERAGLLTSAALLTARSRPDAASVVSRGLLVMAKFTCDEAPPFPELIDEFEPLEGATEREKAEQRMQAPACGECHSLIDPYGLALDRFDLIGRYRTTDAEGRPIDTQVTLKDATPVSGAVELAEYIVSDDKFAACLARHWLQYGLAELSVSPNADGCATQAVVARLEQTSKSFADLIAEVSVSSMLTQRVGGTAP